MKTLVLTFAVLLTVTLQSFTVPFSAYSFTNWDKLGEKKVNFSLDKDEISVGIVQGLYSAIKLKVNGGAINLHKVQVVFDNGNKQEFTVRKNIPAGGETRELQLNGANLRIIKKVIMMYDKENKNANTTVAVWGKH